jgi:Asp-tRNA(Asn)/Glu-tRNA(Gln) amidotransferase A subunit family amidase
MVPPIAAESLIDIPATLQAEPERLVGYLNDVCDRIDEQEPTLHALVPEASRRERLLNDAATLEPMAALPLFGVPVAVKDIIRVDGLPTRGGSDLPPEVFAGRQAEVVATVRAAGALVLGKSVTTEFAFADPGPTTNPHNPAHTPGGSSSGSAAAVAAGYTPLALGTQTADSIITPATYCGVVGFKPSFGRIPLDGVIPFSPSMDTVGFFTRDVASARLASAILCDRWRDVAALASTTLAVPSDLLQRVEPQVRAEFEAQLDAITAADAEVIEIPVGWDLEELRRLHYRLIAAEFAAGHADRHRRYGERYRHRSAALFEKGAGLPDVVINEGRASGARLRERVERLMDEAGVDAWLCPSARGPAPAGLDFIGDPILPLPWTHAHLPVVTIPAGWIGGLPLGAQLVGRGGADEELLAVAETVTEAISRNNRQPQSRLLA